MSSVKKIEALVVVLRGATPDPAAIDEAISILVTYVAKLPRKSRVLAYGELHLAESAAPRRWLSANRRGLRHGVLCARPGEFYWAMVGDVSGVYDAYTNGAGGVTIPEDGGFTWPWSVLAPALADAIAALPSRARTPRPVTCPHCQREFYR